MVAQDVVLHEAKAINSFPSFSTPVAMPEWGDVQYILLALVLGTCGQILLSYTLLVPLLHVWRQFIKHSVYGNLAYLSAGVTRHEHGRRVYEKFVEQGWLSLHYSLVVGLGLYVLMDRPWWPPLQAQPGAFRASLEELAQDRDVYFKV